MKGLELVLNNLEVTELNDLEKVQLDGGKCWCDIKKLFKFKWTGFLDGDRKNDKIELSICGYQII